MEQEPCPGQREIRASASRHILQQNPVLINVTLESQAEVREKGGGLKCRRDRTTDTFKHGQPCRVMRVPNRIPRQAGILPSVLKRDISQLEDFHFLVGGVKASGLENNKDPTRGPTGEGGEKRNHE